MTTPDGVETLSLPDRLRIETRPAHDAIERAVDLYGRCATLEGYTDLLVRLRGFHAVFETSASPLIADPSLFDPRRKLQLLDADLDYLGVASPLPEETTPVLEPWISTAEAAMGSLYVLEGSTLGGRVIARFLAERHGLGPGRGATATTATALRQARCGAASRGI